MKLLGTAMGIILGCWCGGEAVEARQSKVSGVVTTLNGDPIEDVGADAVTKHSFESQSKSSASC